MYHICATLVVQPQEGTGSERVLVKVKYQKQTGSSVSPHQNLRAHLHPGLKKHQINDQIRSMCVFPTCSEVVSSLSPAVQFQYPFLVFFPPERSCMQHDMIVSEGRVQVPYSKTHPLINSLFFLRNP